MSCKPCVTRAATLLSSSPVGDQNYRSAVRGHHVLERHDAAVRERHRFNRVRNAGWNLGIVKRIVEWVAEESEAAMMMKAARADKPVAEARPVRPVIWIVIRCVV